MFYIEVSFRSEAARREFSIPDVSQSPCYCCPHENRCNVDSKADIVYSEKKLLKWKACLHSSNLRKRTSNLMRMICNELSRNRLCTDDASSQYITIFNEGAAKAGLALDANKREMFSETEWAYDETDWRQVRMLRIFAAIWNNGYSIVNTEFNTRKPRNAMNHADNIQGLVPYLRDFCNENEN